MTQFLPFALPDIGDEEIAEVVRSLRSGWLSTGPRARAFEDAFAAMLGGGVHTVAVNSATAGLHLAVEALGIGPGDQVIVPTHTFTATAEVVRYVGADVIFADIDPETYCIDPRQIESRATARTKAVIPVHYGGQGCDMRAILEISQQLGLAVVEDAAHALPTHVGGKLVGTLDSDCAVFSFYATKTITTGEGGMLVTRDERIASRARVMRLHGIDRDAFDRYQSNRPSWYYEVIAPGFKYNLTDLAAAIGLQQLGRTTAFHARRLQLAERYDMELAELPIRLPPRSDGKDHAWHLYVIQLLDTASLARDEFIARMHEGGIACSVHYIPLHQQPYWRQRYDLKAADFPHSQGLFERCVSLPIYTKMSDDDQSRVVNQIRRLLQ